MHQTLGFTANRNVVFVLILLIIATLSACSDSSDSEIPAEGMVNEIVFEQAIQLSGDWILEQDGKAMLDPQTSGLSFANGVLYTVSDGSAHASQIQQIHKLDPMSGAIVGRLGPMQLSEKVTASCFAAYLQNKPDYEAIVALPNKKDTWLLVTEDASKADKLSADCAAKFSETGSTEYPTLLVKVQLLEQGLVVNGVRALQFDAKFSVGNFPNDGIEGMAVARDGRILFGLEKDANTQARVFDFDYSDDLFEGIDNFISVRDSDLWLPRFTQGNHPINGMDIYYPNDSSAGYLVLAARNDDQLWFVDLQKQKPTKVLNVEFSVNCRGGISGDATTQSLQKAPVLSTHSIANTALEGVAIVGRRLYLINDPWKKVYRDNKTCDKDQSKYESMSPMLFQTDIDPKWLE